jgi:hypothetical protein
LIDPNSGTCSDSTDPLRCDEEDIGIEMSDDDSGTTSRDLALKQYNTSINEGNANKGTKESSSNLSD